MAGYHTVKQGDCLSSIAKLYGFAKYETIWNRPENEALRTKRKDPNVLQPGDRVFVPERESRSEQRGTDASHRFVAKKQSTFLRIVVQLDGEPVADAAYKLKAGDDIILGTTDGGGVLREPIDPGVTQADLHFDDPQMDWELRLGGLDPVNEMSGVQQRLNNLGFSCGEPDGIIGPRTRGALRLFQKRNGLPPSGKADAATIQKLLSAHDEG